MLNAFNYPLCSNYGGIIGGFLLGAYGATCMLMLVDHFHSLFTMSSPRGPPLQISFNMTRNQAIITVDSMILYLILHNSCVPK